MPWQAANPVGKAAVNAEKFQFQKSCQILLAHLEDVPHAGLLLLLLFLHDTQHLRRCVRDGPHNAWGEGTCSRSLWGPGGVGPAVEPTSTPTIVTVLGAAAC